MLPGELVPDSLPLDDKAYAPISRRAIAKAAPPTEPSLKAAMAANPPATTIANPMTLRSGPTTFLRRACPPRPANPNLPQRPAAASNWLPGVPSTDPWYSLQLFGHTRVMLVGVWGVGRRTRMATCPNGHVQSENVRFCGECGAAVTAEESTSHRAPRRIPGDRRHLALVAVPLLLVAGWFLLSRGHTLQGAVFEISGDSSFCSGSDGGYWVADGSPVTVENESGEIVGTGELSGGKPFQTVGCEYAFSVKVGDADFYTIRVGDDDSDPIRASKGELEKLDWNIAITIGR